MLPNPLSELYRDGALYDEIFPGNPDSGLFLAAQAQRTGGPILELACGTGILALPLAERGYHVTGLDMSPAMLAFAQQKTRPGLKLTWVQGDMRDFDLQEQFPLIFLVHNSSSHLLTTEDFSACLACVHRHLAPGGLFIINTFMPDPERLQNRLGIRTPLGRYRDPETGNAVHLFEESAYDAVNQIKRATIYRQSLGERAQRLGELQLRMYFPKEFDALLQWNGFQIQRKLGNYRGAPFGAGTGQATETQLCICSAVAQR